MISRRGKLVRATAVAAFFAVSGCGDGSAPVDPTEVKDGNTLTRMHERSPVPFNELMKFDEKGAVVMWRLSAPYGKQFFGDFGVLLDDMNSDSRMDSLGLSLKPSTDADVFVEFFDRDSDGIPDMFTYGVLAGEHSRKVVDLDLDGNMDFKDDAEGMKILVNGEWLAVKTVGELRESDAPDATTESGVGYVFREGVWELEK